jgi:hypothetical protein
MIRTVLYVQIEYQIEECSSENRAKNDCVHVQVAKQILPRGGDIVFGVAHQHSGGIAASLHGEVASTTDSICLHFAGAELSIIV